MVVATHLVITLHRSAGVRMVCEFLKLSGLSTFVGASYGTEQALTAALEGAVVAVGPEQRAELAVGMSHRLITVCQEEPRGGCAQLGGVILSMSAIGNVAAIPIQSPMTVSGRLPTVALPESGRWPFDVKPWECQR